MEKPKAFWNIWSSYAVYYFGKVNLGIVVPALLLANNSLNLYNVGLVSSGFFFAYAIGQFLHGQISERFNPFVYIAIGLLGSAAMNLLLGFSAGFFLLLFLGEVFDGLFQSMGWSSCVRANAILNKEEKTTTLLGTSYQLGNSVAWLISAFVVGKWGWQAGFFVASAIMASRGILLLLMKPEIKYTPNKVKTQIKNTLTPSILLGGVALCFLNMVRYGVITWIPLYLFKLNNLTVQQMGKVGLNVCLIPIAGILGTLVYNLFKIKRDLITVIFLAFLAVSFMILPFVEGTMATVVLLIGSFFLYGPHVFLVATLPSRFLDKKVVAAATGFIDGMGYVGTVLVGILVPILIGLFGGWTAVFYFWAILSVFVMVTVITIYLTKFRFN